MTKDILNAREAAELFLTRLIGRGFQGPIDDTISMLEKGPVGRKPSETKLSIHKWYQTLDSQGRALANALVRQTAESAVFGCLVILDNTSGGYPIQAQLSDFALYVQTYENADKQKSNEYSSSSRINPGYSTEDHLHDKFLIIVRGINGRS